MNERLTKVKSDSSKFWTSRTKNQKGVIIGALIAIIALAATITYFSTRTTMVPLFAELSSSEVGKIAEVLDAQGATYEIAPGGTNILVPAEQADALKVSLVAQGYPETGAIDNSFFTANAGFGMTDNEFNVIKLAAMETELARLVSTVEGVKSATVKIAMPDESLFIRESQTEASVAISLNTEPGYKFTEEQVKTLYNLVSKSIPNLSTDNIVITNQYADDFDLIALGENNSANSIEGQMAIKKTIERDLQKQVQNMLGTLMGQDKVVVSVTTDVDFKKENREESLVTPVDEENMSGIEISAQRITETYTGNAPVSGSPEAENVTDNFTDYVEGTTTNGDYERVEETINNDVNRIRKEIQEAPYKIRNLGIQVMVEPPEAENPESLSPDVQAAIQQILTTVVRTSMDQEIVNTLTPEEIEERVVVLVQPFYGKDVAADTETAIIPWWVWVLGGILLVAIILLVVYIVRSRKRKQLEEEQQLLDRQEEMIEVEDISEEKETEATVRRKQLEKMAKEKPDEFAKLLRTWITED